MPKQGKKNTALIGDMRQMKHRVEELILFAEARAKEPANVDRKHSLNGVAHDLQKARSALTWAIMSEEKEAKR